MRVVIGSLFLLLLLPGQLSARTWHVPAEAPTIQAGIDSSAVNDVVEIASGFYFEHDIVMKSGITLRGETTQAPDVTIDAAWQGRVLICEDLDQATYFMGLTFSCGRMPDNADYGGAILCVNSTVSFTNCDIVDSYSGYAGGGLASSSSQVYLERCRFIDNESYMSGGGMYINLGDIEVLHCLFETNISTDGAGIFCQRTSPLIEWCTFLNNDGLFFGGAIYLQVEASPTIRNCSLVGNQAYLGGGIMTVGDSYPLLENCIIAYSIDGAGLHYDGNGGDTTRVHVECCDLFGNEGGSYSGWIEDQTGINGNINADPWFCDLPLGDITLATGSPCLPAGNDCSVLMGAWSGGCSIAPATELVLAGPRLESSYPNPFNPATNIAFSLIRPQRVTLALYDIQGRLVTILADRTFERGSHSEPWDGRDAAGRDVPSGTYFARMATADGVQTSKLMLLR